MASYPHEKVFVGLFQKTKYNQQKSKNTRPKTQTQNLPNPRDSEKDLIKTKNKTEPGAGMWLIAFLIVLGCFLNILTFMGFSGVDYFLIIF